MLKKTLLDKRHFQLWSYCWLFKWVRTVLHVFFPKIFTPTDGFRQQATHCFWKCVKLFVRKVETLHKLTNKTQERFVWWIPTYAKWRELRCISHTYEHFCLYESLVNRAPGVKKYKRLQSVCNIVLSSYFYKLAKINSCLMGLTILVKISWNTSSQSTVMNKTPTTNSVDHSQTLLIM